MVNQVLSPCVAMTKVGPGGGSKEQKSSLFLLMKPGALNLVLKPGAINLALKFDAINLVLKPDATTWRWTLMLSIWR